MAGFFAGWLAEGRFDTRDAPAPRKPPDARGAPCVETTKIWKPPHAVRSLDVALKCIYIMNIQVCWSQTKRQSNFTKHGLDFADAQRVFAGLTFTFEDDCFDYDEQRFITRGLLDRIPVSLVHTETSHEIRIISFRKATAREARIWREQVDGLDQ